MFSNGTEYMIFLDANCNECPHYVDYYDDDPDNVCEVEDKLSRAALIESEWPAEWLDNLPGEGYSCRKKKGLDKKQEDKDGCGKC